MEQKTQRYPLGDHDKGPGMSGRPEPSPTQNALLPLPHGSSSLCVQIKVFLFEAFPSDLTEEDWSQNYGDK